MVLNATFNNISVILLSLYRQSVLLVEETRVTLENHRLIQVTRWQTSSRNVVSSTPRLGGILTHKVSGDRF